mgnify:CR=1 FL=1
MEYNFDSIFPRYNGFDPRVPVWCVTPDVDRAIHRFFDTSPISPSGRYLALTQLHSEEKLPEPGETAEVVVIDLATGENRIVAETKGWDTQLGAQVQWGKYDTQLFFNDVDTREWRPFGVKMNIFSGERISLDGTIYMVSPDGRYALSPCLARIGATQPGYGVIVPAENVPKNQGLPDDDGIYITDTKSGKSRLLVSIKTIVETAVPSINMDEFENGTFYGFHVKWNPQGTRIMFVLRFLSAGKKYEPMLITMKPDGTDIRLAIPASEWAVKGGHHPNWYPDGEYILMNLKIDQKELRFVKARYDGSQYGVLVEGVTGSGHPTLHPNGTKILTDSYVDEMTAFSDGTTPIRLVDMRTAEVIDLIRIRTKPAYSGPKKELRVDPHPAWDPTFRYIVFNACPEGKRKVFIADISSFVD